MLTRRAVLQAAVVAASGPLLSCAPRGRRSASHQPVAKPTLPFERIAYGSGPQQFCELRRPAGPARALVVVVHGGFWQSQDGLDVMLPVCEALTREGFATW